VNVECKHGSNCSFEPPIIARVLSLAKELETFFYANQMGGTVRADNWWIFTLTLYKAGMQAFKISIMTQDSSFKLSALLMAQTATNLASVWNYSDFKIKYLNVGNKFLYLNSNTLFDNDICRR